MRGALIAGLVSFGGTFAAAPVVRAALVRRGSMDIPNHRSSHVAPVPRGGGLACLTGVALGVLATERQCGVGQKVVLSTGALAALGLADDQLGHVHHNVRLVGQAVAGAVLAPTAATVLPVATGTVGVVNVFNFMDGINGISGATAAVWGLATLAVGRGEQEPTLQTLGAVTAGAGLGFLPWNAPDAQLFLGDVGSYLFGGLIAAGLAHAVQRPSLLWRIAAPLLPYGLDATVTLVRRLAAGERLTEAHRDHAYQRLVDLHGISHSNVAIAHAAAAGAIALVSGIRAENLGRLLSVTIACAYVAAPQLLPRLPKVHDA